MLVLALPTGHKVGLAVVGLVFILFALGSSFLFPRFRPQYPGRGLPAFIVVAFVFFFGMLTAVEVFGAEPKETKQSEQAAQTFSQATSTTAATATTATTAVTTTQATTTRAAATPAKATTVDVTETEFKIQLAPSSLKAGKVTFRIKNTGKLAHNLAIVGGPTSPLIQPGKTGTLTTTLKPGKVELYCAVPGHKQAGMDVKTTVAGAGQSAPKTAAAPPAAPTSSSVSVTETEFKIQLAPSSLKAGKVTFKIKNTGKLAHNLAIVGGPTSPLIQPGKTGTLTTTLKPGKVELYCAVPGHKQAGMDVKTTVS